MPVTLAEIQKNAQDDIQEGVIDELRRSSVLIDGTIFDDAVHPGGNGGTLTYGYQRVSTYGTAGTRAFNSEYVAQHAAKEQFNVNCRPFGGAFELDRVLKDVKGLADEVAFQTSQKIRATRSEWHDLFINGDVGLDPNGFDGLDVALAGTDTEFGATTVQDWAGVASEADAFAQLDVVDEWLASLHMRPSLIVGNTKSITRFKNLARRAHYLTESEDSFGRQAMAYDGIMLVDLGDKPEDASPIIPIETRNPDGGGNTTNLTDLYAVHLGMDGVHGVTLADGNDLVQPYLDEFMPDFRQSGAVRRGEIEMVAALAVRHTKAAAVLRNIKVGA